MNHKHFSEVEPLSRSLLEAVALSMIEEVERQDRLAREGRFGGTHILPSGPDHARLAVLMEEVGEVARELNEELMHPSGRRGNLWKELVQAGACALAWAVAIEEGRDVP